MARPTAQPERALLRAPHATVGVGEVQRKLTEPIPSVPLRCGEPEAQEEERILPAAFRPNAIGCAEP